jgi:hypothetical protein
MSSILVNIGQRCFRFRASSRVSSSIRLIVEEYLEHAWRAIGHEKDPKIQTTDLDFGFNGMNFLEAECALAGGVLNN